MTLHAWWPFFAAVFLLCGTPGPNMLHIMTRSVSFGVRRSVAAMAGCLTAMLAVLSASAMGMGAVLAASPRLFDAFRYAGVGYLIWLGIKAWRSDAAPVDVGAMPRVAPLSLARLYRGGLVIGLSNPKLLLFAAAFLPQFVDRARPEAPQFAILVATFMAAETFWYAVYGCGGQRLAGLLRRPALRRGFDRLTGVIFIGFGVALLRARR